MRGGKVCLVDGEGERCEKRESGPDEAVVCPWAADYCCGGEGGEIFHWGRLVGGLVDVVSEGIVGGGIEELRKNIGRRRTGE